MGTEKIPSRVNWKEERKAAGAVLFVILLIVLVGWAVYTASRYRDYGMREIFPEYRQDFELVKDLLLEASRECAAYDDDRLFFSPQFNEQGRIIGMKHYSGFDHDHSIELSIAELAALNRTREQILPHWDMVYVEENRISFCSLGSDMVVYAADGKRPRYFYTPTEGTLEFHVEKMDRNWFFVRRSAR